MAAKSHLDFPFSNPRFNARDKTKKRLVNANRGEGGDSNGSEEGYVLEPEK